MKRHHYSLTSNNENALKIIGIRCIGLLGLAFVFLFVFSYNTSPATQIYGGDSSFFQLVGQGMTDGLLPYRDFFDMKGPYLFLIEYFGQILCSGRVGCFIVQWISLSLSLFFSDKIFQLALGKRHLLGEFLLMLPFLWIAAATFEGGNLTEEFCLPALLVCFYCYLRYKRQISEKQHPPQYALIYGAAFGFISFVRITSAASICAIVLCILIRLIANHSFRNILQNAVAFIAGFVLAILPAVIYCLCKGIFQEMIYLVFAFGYIYAAHGGLIEFSLNSLWYYLLIVPPLAMCCFSDNRKSFLLDMVINTFAITLAVSMGNQYLHYFTLIIPLIIVGEYLAAITLKSMRLNWKKIPNSLLIAAVCLLILTPNVIRNGGVFLLSSITDRYVDYQAQEIAEYIPTEDRNKVCGWRTSSRWYLETGIYPCIKYCDWQRNYILLSSRVQKDLEIIFEESAPKWMVVENHDEHLEFTKNILTTKYTPTFANEKYTLYRLQA